MRFRRILTVLRRILTEGADGIRWVVVTIESRSLTGFLVPAMKILDGGFVDPRSLSSGSSRGAWDRDGTSFIKAGRPPRVQRSGRWDDADVRDHTRGRTAGGCAGKSRTATAT